VILVVLEKPDQPLAMIGDGIELVAPHSEIAPSLIHRLGCLVADLGETGDDEGLGLDKEIAQRAQAPLDPAVARIGVVQTQDVDECCKREADPERKQNPRFQLGKRQGMLREPANDRLAGDIERNA
jgi:hypothetical protein